jgi:hypothetical protein
MLLYATQHKAELCQARFSLSALECSGGLGYKSGEIFACLPKLSVKVKNLSGLLFAGVGIFFLFGHQFEFFDAATRYEDL